MWCCAGDEGVVALRRRPTGGDVKPPHAALAEDRRGERCGKGTLDVSGMGQEGERKRTAVDGEADCRPCCAIRVSSNGQWCCQLVASAMMLAMATRVGSGLAQLQFGWARLVRSIRTSLRCGSTMSSQPVK